MFKEKPTQEVAKELYRKGCAVEWWCVCFQAGLCSGAWAHELIDFLDYDDLFCKI